MGTRLFTIFSVVSCLAVCQGQTSSTISLSNGLRVRITASTGQPPEGQALTADLAAASGNSVYRIFRDENQLAVFAYELTFERTEDGNRVLLTVTPAGDAFASKFPRADGGKPTPTLPAARAYPPLSSGKRLTIGLFDMPPAGKIADTVEIGLNPEPSEGDDSGDMRFVGLTVNVTGPGAMRATGAPARVAGPYVMFYIPGRGGYFFSTTSPPGRPFLKVGWIDGSLLRFTVEDENYECMAQQPILARSGTSEVWVYYDRQYKPAGNWTSGDPAQKDSSAAHFFAAASDSLDWFPVPKISEPARQ